LRKIMTIKRLGGTSSLAHPPFNCPEWAPTRAGLVYSENT
jgi:hypothetical protein